MATKLGLFNGALLMLGERSLATLTENREPRRLLDIVWDGGGVRTCLEAGIWNFAVRAARIEYDPSAEPGFGFDRAFTKETDWVRTSIVSADEYFNPMKAYQFADETDYWYSNIETLYVKYVSDGGDYGNNLAIWPESFARYVEAYMAVRIGNKLTRSGTMVQTLKDDLKRLRDSALSKDAMNEGTQFAPEGSWNRARRGYGRRDRGSRRNLIG